MRFSYPVNTSIDQHHRLRTCVALLAAALVVALADGPAVVAQPTAQRHSLVQLDAAPDAAARLLALLGIDHATSVDGRMQFAVDEEQLRWLRSSGAAVHVVIESLETFYSARAAAARQAPAAMAMPGIDPVNFRPGSVLGQLTIEELTEQLQQMHQKFPAIAAEPISIGTTHQGRQILAVRLSAADPSDTTVAEALFTGMIHAREPSSMGTLVYTMWALCEAYGADEGVTWLLQNRALWFVPLINPDGYQYNLTNWPDGGGMFRGNMRDAGRNAVDLNRNFGPFELWDHPDGGSDTTPSSPLYRGSEPFSEPETRALRDFCNSRRFGVALNQHCFSNLLIYPVELSQLPERDSAYYYAASRELAASTGYAAGAPRLAVGYAVRGSSDRWMFHAGQGHEPIIAWAPEIGSEYDGFWPLPERVIPLARQSHPMHLQAAMLAGAYPAITSVSRFDAESGPGLRVVIQNLGRLPMRSTASLRASGIDGALPIPRLDPLEQVRLELPVPEELVARATPRHQLEFVVEYEGGRFAHRAAPILMPLAELFVENAETTLAQWRADAWGVEHVPGRGRVLADSPDGPYVEVPSTRANLIETRQAVSLRGYDAAELHFDASSEFMARGHEGTLEVRVAGESEWRAIGGPYMQIRLSEPDSVTSRFRGVAGGWHHYVVDLDQFAGVDIHLRFGARTPRAGFGVTANGLLLDDIRVIAARAEQSSVPPSSSSSRLRLRAAPNPFIDRLHVRLEGASARTEFELVDLLGRVVRRSAGGTSAVLDAAGLPAGYYVVVARHRDFSMHTGVWLQR